MFSATRLRKGWLGGSPRSSLKQGKHSYYLNFQLHGSFVTCCNIYLYRACFWRQDIDSGGN